MTKGEDGRFYNARIKGVLKIEGITSTNPIAVGDEVEMEVEDVQEESAIISEILDRRNYIARVSPHNKRQHHIIASNVDQSLLFVTLRDPRTSQGFIDRFLISCEAYHVPAILLFNKADLYRNKEIDRFVEMKEMFEKVGYTVLLTSVKEEQGLDAVKELLKDKVTLLSGHSGVGKSTLINALFPNFKLRTSEVSSWSGKGMHTTTFAEMFDLPDGGQVIDTPGIRELGLVDIEKTELSHYFPEMRNRLQDCQFNNCLHLEEPGCAIKAAVANGEIHEDRYMSYYNLYHSMEDEW